VGRMDMSSIRRACPVEGMVRVPRMSQNLIFLLGGTFVLEGMGRE
jgi:hypothetical protein